MNQTRSLLHVAARKVRQNILDGLYNDTVDGRYKGICFKIGVELYDIPHELRSDAFRLLPDIMIDWPHHSGDEMFPVPYPNKDAYNGYVHDADKYNPHNPSYAMRMNLLEFIIESTKPCLNKQQNQRSMV